VARILVVEDEPAIALGLEDDLKLEGYQVEAVTDGARALARAREGQFDLILLDVLLPEKDGFTVCRELRADGVRTPIIMLTAKGQEIDKVVGLEVGADDYVTKPFSPRELVARIKAVLRRAAEPPAPVRTYQFGDVTVDFGKFEAMRKGRKIPLTALEFKLLRAFLQHPGQVLTRNQLLDATWGSEVFLTDRIVDVHIKNLRKKIEANPSKPRFLVSVRGIGYRFDL
jgi:DNA-binding response OmpR family regulator